MKKLIIIRGPLGVGKTTVATLLAQQLNADYVSLDKILEEHKLIPADADGVPLASFLKANEILRARATQSNNTLVVDGCFYYQEQIDDIVQAFHDDVAIFTLLSDVDTCIARDANRQHVYGEDAARFVHLVTTQVKAGCEIDSSTLSPQEVVARIVEMV